MRENGDRDIDRFRGMLKRVSEGNAFFSRFMDPRTLELCRAAAIKEGVPFRSYGGFLDAERHMACASMEAVEDAAYPMTCVKLTWSKDQQPPAHRDILGALTAMGIDRSCFGDIMPGEAEAYVAVADTVAPYVLAEMRQAGRCYVSAEACVFGDAAQRAGVAMKVNLPSLRMDALLQAALRMPRTSAQALVEQGRVKLNHAEQRNNDAPLKAGDIISVRGFGRIKVAALAGESRKGRLFLAIEVFT